VDGLRTAGDMLPLSISVTMPFNICDAFMPIWAAACRGEG
jgi:hypothetical protein